MITAYDMTTQELTARLEALADHKHPELLSREVNNIWRQVCREAATRLRSTEADQRDAARYRWVQREVDLRGLPEIVRVAIYKQDGNALDLAIDAAMRQSAPDQQ